jgi:uncharacterized membrane protein
MTESWFSHGVMFGLLIGFAIAHSGLAALRPKAEQWVGARLYRIFFALVSIPFASVLIIYFINHRYDGIRLWNLHATPGIESLVWSLSFLSFLFLYPATFNLLEIAAVQKPQVHLYESGIIRITRHPQMVGQGIWCVAHCLWLGTTFTLITSLGLMFHHGFAVWHGDRRLLARYGESFEKVKERTSIVPFLAIFQGRQTLELKEFIRPAYAGVVLFILIFWWLHPSLIQATAKVAL